MNYWRSHADGGLVGVAAARGIGTGRIATVDNGVRLMEGADLAAITDPGPIGEYVESRT